MTTATTATLLTFADLTLDQSAHAATRGRRELALTLTEFRVLETLLHRPGQVLTSQQLYAAATGFDHAPDSRTVAMHIYRLRAKLEAAGEPRLIQTVRGVGFVLREPPARPRAET